MLARAAVAPTNGGPSMSRASVLIAVALVGSSCAADKAVEPTGSTEATAKPAVTKPSVTTPPAATQPAVDTAAVDLDAFESTDILVREAVADKADVKHVLIAWADLAAAYGQNMPEKAKTRTKAEATTLAAEILERATAGEDFVALMKEHSEDWGSAKTGESYPVTADARLVPPFKKLSLRLKKGEAGAVQTRYGWHVIKRFE